MISSSNLIPIYFPQMANDGVITKDELAEGFVIGSVTEYQGAEVGDYISLSFDVTMTFYRYLESEPVSQYFPWSIEVPAELVPDGSYQSWYSIIDIAGNSSASPITTVFIDREQQGTLPAPTFPEAEVNNNVIDDVLAFSDGGTSVQVPVYNGMSIDDNVLVYWSGFNEEGLLVPGSATTVAHLVIAEDLTFGFTVNITTPYITVIGTGTAKSWYTVHSDTRLPERSEDSELVEIDTIGQLLPAPLFPEGGDSWIDAQEAADGTPLTVPVYRNISIGDIVTTYWQGYTNIGVPVPGAYNQQSHQIVSSDLNNGFSINLPESVLLPISVGYGQSYYTVDFIAGGVERGTSLKAQVGVDTAHVTFLPPPVFPEATNNTISTEDAVSDGGTPMVISYTDSLTGSGMTIGDTLTIQWSGYHYGDVNPIPGAFFNLTHTVTINDLQTGYVNITIPTEYIVTIGTGYAIGNYQVAFQAGGIGNSTTSNVLISSDIIVALTSDTTDIADDGISVATLSAFVSDVGGNPVASALVEWSAPTGTLNPSVSFTDQSGIATTQFTSTIIGDASITASLTNQSSRTIIITVEEAVSYEIDNLQTNKTPIEADGLDSATLSATVVDNLGNVAENVVVYWNISAGSGALTSTSSITNVSGVATTQLTSSVAGSITVVATLADQSSRSIQITSESVNKELITDLQTDKTPIDANGIDTATLSATVEDGLGNVAANILVYWSVTDGTGTVTPTSSVTNAAGIASTQLTSNTVGTMTIMATLDNQSSRTIQITAEEVQTKLHVMGARSSIHASCQSQVGRLAVFDASDLTSLDAYWFYEGDSPTEASHSFIDTKPHLLLNVQSSPTSSNTVVLYPSNVTGNGNWDDSGTGKGSFSAVLNNATAVGWGDANYGGSTPPSTYNQSVYSLSATFEAFGSIRSPNMLYAWGASEEGGTVPSSIISRNDIVEVKGAQGTFACRGTQNLPYIQVWGWATDGCAEFDLNVPTNIASMSDITSLHAGDNAFAVLTSSGIVYAWGDASAGGNIPDSIKQLNNITQCCSSRRAFAVIYDGGRLQAWGDTDYGSDSSSVSYTSTAERLVATESAFTSLLSTGGIVCWGYEEYGGNLPSKYASRTDIVDVKSTYGAFAALCADGTVFCWGNSGFGGNCESVSSQLVDIVAISANGASFAALKRNGTVVTWGDTEYGGSTSGATGPLTDIQAIYGNTHAFIALRGDGTVIAWGEQASGVSSLPSTLNGNLTYLKK